MSQLFVDFPHLFLLAQSESYFHSHYISVGLCAQANSIQWFFECPICYSDIEEATMTICGHRYCKRCIVAAIATHARCPLCNRPLHVPLNLAAVPSPPDNLLFGPGSDLLRDHSFESLFGILP